MDVREAEEEVIGQPERVEANLLRAPRHRRDIGPARSAPAPWMLKVRDKESDFQRPPPGIHLNLSSPFAVPALLEPKWSSWHG